MHSLGYRVTLILKNNATAKISGYHPDGKRKFPYKFQLSLTGGTGLEKAESDINIYGKQLNWLILA